MCIWDYQEDPPIAGHREPEVIRVGIIKTFWIGPECDIMFKFVIVLLSINFKV